MIGAKNMTKTTTVKKLSTNLQKGVTLKLTKMFFPNFMKLEIKRDNKLL